MEIETIKTSAGEWQAWITFGELAFSVGDPFTYQLDAQEFASSFENELLEHFNEVLADLN